jgi:DNA-binding NarL/FixJ family response regulator
VLLIDYHLPDGTGVDAVRGLAAATPKIVFLSSERSDAAVLAALEAGACGYLVKSEPLDQLVRAVRRAAEGEILLQAGELAALLGSQRERQRREAELERATAGLTAREHEILRLMAQDLALTTVRWYVQILLEKLEVHSKLSAVARAAELGLIER